MVICILFCTEMINSNDYLAKYSNKITKNVTIYSDMMKFNIDLDLNERK